MIDTSEVAVVKLDGCYVHVTLRGGTVHTIPCRSAGEARRMSETLIQPLWQRMAVTGFCLAMGAMPWVLLALGVASLLTWRVKPCP